MYLSKGRKEDPDVTDIVRRSYQDDAPITPACSIGSGASGTVVAAALGELREHGFAVRQAPSDASPQSRSA